jgi:hypothetical protein
MKLSRQIARGLKPETVGDTRLEWQLSAVETLLHSAKSFD